MREQRKFICIVCPVGCSIMADVEDGELVQMQGQGCRRGEAFVREELTAPKRVLTTTVRVMGGRRPLVSVRSNAPLPKERLLSVVRELRYKELSAPVAQYQIVWADVEHTGVDIVTTRAVPVRDA